MNRLEFTVYMKPEPQGSAKAFVIAGRAHITSDNKKMKPFRSEVTSMALACLEGSIPMCAKQVPVRVQMVFTFLRPAAAKKRQYPSVKPDIDKLQRAILDSLTGVAFADDSQVVSALAFKRYGQIESTRVVVEEIVQPSLEVNQDGETA